MAQKKRRTPADDEMDTTSAELDPTTLITGVEAREILRICDKTQVAFANFIGHSANFVRGEKILGASRYVRLQWVRALRAFVSEADYLTALAIIRQDAARRHESARGHSATRGSRP